MLQVELRDVQDLAALALIKALCEAYIACRRFYAGLYSYVEVQEGLDLVVIAIF